MGIEQPKLADKGASFFVSMIADIRTDSLRSDFQLGLVGRP